MASITKRGKTYQYTVSRYTNGKYDPIRKGGFKSKKEAEVAALEVELQTKKNRTVIVKDKSFAMLFKEWINTYKNDIQDKTKRRYIAHQKLVEEYFKDMPVQAISKSDYQQFLNKYADKHAKESTRKLNTNIRACIKSAVEDGYIQKDFTNNAVIYGKVAAKKEEDKYIEYEEAKKLYKYLIEEDKTYISHYLILLGLVSGMRFGELAGLTRNDFDFEENTITVTKSWNDEENRLGDTKNEQSKRTLLIDMRVMDKFQEWFSSTDERELIFSDPLEYYGVITNAAVNKAFKKILKQLGIKQITMHGLRHTHGSMLLADGASVAYVSERLGHADIQTTNNIYSHVLKKLRAKEDRRAIHLFDDALE